MTLWKRTCLDSTKSSGHRVWKCKRPKCPQERKEGFSLYHVVWKSWIRSAWKSLEGEVGVQACNAEEVASGVHLLNGLLYCDMRAVLNKIFAMLITVDGACLQLACKWLLWHAKKALAPIGHILCSSNAREPRNGSHWVTSFPNRKAENHGDLHFSDWPVGGVPEVAGCSRSPWDILTQSTGSTTSAHPIGLLKSLR